MSDVRVASRYAQGLYDLAAERGEVETVKADMELFAATVNSNRELAVLLRNPVLREERKASLLRAVFDGKVSALSASMFQLIARKQRAEVLTAMAQQFITLYNRANHITVATVATAVPLTDQQRQQMSALVEKYAASKQVKLEEKVDQKLLGGFVLTIGDRQIDQSLRSKLAQVRSRLTDETYIDKI